MSYKLKSFYVSPTGAVDTYFIDEHPQLFMFKASQNRAQKILSYLGQVLVNGPATPLATKIPPADVKPYIPPVPLGNKLLLTN